MGKSYNRRIVQRQRNSIPLTDTSSSDSVSYLHSINGEYDNHDRKKADSFWVSALSANGKILLLNQNRILEPYFSGLIAEKQIIAERLDRFGGSIRQ